MKKCTGQLMAKDSAKKLQEHYSFMFNGSVQSYNGYIKSGVVSGKSWLAGKDKDVCEVCKMNERAGVIPLTAKFPSGHLFPPAGQLCRCCLLPEVENSDAPPLPDGYSIKSKWKGDTLTMTVVKKPSINKHTSLFGLLNKK